MDKLMPMLIERAKTLRDRLGAKAREAAQTLAQTQATQQRLEQFRVECLLRSPGRAGSQVDAQALNDYQRFIARLDQAIAMQRLECRQREAHCAAARQLLAEAQQRLMAFETLVRRRAAERDLKDARRAQQASDEFAARAHRLLGQEAFG